MIVFAGQIARRVIMSDDFRLLFVSECFRSRTICEIVLGIGRDGFWRARSCEVRLRVAGRGIARKLNPDGSIRTHGRVAWIPGSRSRSNMRGRNPGFGQIVPDCQVGRRNTVFDRVHGGRFGMAVRPVFAVRTEDTGLRR